MSSADADLDRHVNAILVGAVAVEDVLDAETIAVVRRVQLLAARPVPDPCFVRQLKDELMAGAEVGDVPGLVGAEAEAPWRVPASREEFNQPRRSGQGPRPWWQRLQIAAVLLALVALTGYLVVAEQGRRTARTPSAVSLGTPLVAGGSTPLRLRIEAIGVDAPIERVDWLAGGPSSVLSPAASVPWVVAWRAESAKPGEGGNVVLDGQFAQGANGSAVFADLDDVTTGDRIEVTGANQAVFTYVVEWQRRYPVPVHNDQVQEILGPTPTESVTLLTDAGAYDPPTMSYPEVLVVRARLQAVSQPWAPLPPDPAECRIEPRTIAELERSAAIAATESSAVSNEKGDFGPTILPASADIYAKVEAAEREFVACLNANDPLRITALYTDKGLIRLLRFAAGPLGGESGWAPDVPRIAMPATPVPEERRHVLLALEDVRLLADGRIAATVTIGPGGTDMFGVPTGEPVVHILKRGDRYLIDEFIVPSLGTPTP